jgi:hypothetical protein
LIWINRVTFSTVLFDSHLPRKDFIAAVIRGELRTLPVDL